MSDSAPVSPGFHGKVPGLGDFVHRRLPRAFRDNWDSWLQTVIANSRQEMGETWLDTYLSSPVWRWALAPGADSPSAWAGVLMPSVDRVGRYFPLTIAVSLPPTTNLFRLVHDTTSWFDAAETVALSALDEDEFELEAFSNVVAELGACDPLPDWPQPLHVDGALRLAVHGVDSIGSGLADLAAAMLAGRFDRASFWWTQGSDLIEPSMLICDGLPDAGRWTALLDGQWRARGWIDFDTGLDSAQHELPGDGIE